MVLYEPWFLLLAATLYTNHTFDMYVSVCSCHVRKEPYLPSGAHNDIPGLHHLCGYKNSMKASQTSDTRRNLINEAWVRWFSFQSGNAGPADFLGSRTIYCKGLTNSQYCGPTLFTSLAYHIPQTWHRVFPPIPFAAHRGIPAGPT